MMSHPDVIVTYNPKKPPLAILGLVDLGTTIGSKIKVLTSHSLKQSEISLLETKDRFVGNVLVARCLARIISCSSPLQLYGADFIAATQIDSRAKPRSSRSVAPEVT